MSTLWDNMLLEFVKEYKQSPDTFLRQPTIAKTVHPNCDKLSVKYYNEMINNSFFVDNILPGMKDSSVGTPLKFSKHPLCSPLTVQHAYHLYLMVENLETFIPTDTINHIVEIGGGYGNLCRLIKNYGYEGTYSIVDFPQMLSIQEDYLTKHAITDVNFSGLDMEQLAPGKNDTSILIATFSINEMPMETRKVLEPHYKDYDYLFFAHNTSFDGVDNMKYFSDLKETLESEFYINYVKDKYKNSWFMMCQRRN